MTNQSPSFVLDKKAIARAAHLLGDTWCLLILSELLNGSRRFGELQDALEKISPQTLTNRLKMLEKFGFVVREAFLEIPPRVEYHLTERGQAVRVVLQALAEFGSQHMPDPDSADCADETPKLD